MFKMEDISTSPSNTQVMDILNFDVFLTGAENDFNMSPYLVDGASSEETLDVAAIMAPKLKYNPETNPSFIPFRRGTNATQTARNIKNVYGENCTNERTTRYWFSQFRSRNFDLKNEACGRPETLVTNKELKAIVEADETQSTAELAAAFDSSPRGPPQKTNEGIAAFELEIDGSQTQKKKYVFSHLLNRIYVMMECNFSITFKWDVSKVPQREMYVRATVVFADPEQSEKRVERCLQHAHATCNEKTTDPVVINNVLRSAREMGDPNVFYCGNPEETDVWYSVVVKLNGPTSHAYNFVCKNSCSSGINRRAIDIIFTLEDALGTVYGRQWVGARICSCICRDKKAQEREFRASGGKRELPRKQQPAKKIKLEVDQAAMPNTDAEVVRLPEMDVVGPQEAISSLKVAHRIIAQMRAIKQTHQQPVDGLDRCIDNIKNTIDHLEAI